MCKVALMSLNRSGLSTNQIIRVWVTKSLFDQGKVAMDLGGRLSKGDT